MWKQAVVAMVMLLCASCVAGIVLAVCEGGWRWRTTRPTENKLAIREFCRRRVQEYHESVAADKNAILLTAQDAAIWFWEGQTPEEVQQTKEYLVCTGVAQWICRQAGAFRVPTRVD